MENIRCWHFKRREQLKKRVKIVPQKENNFFYDVSIRFDSINRMLLATRYYSVAFVLHASKYSKKFLRLFCVWKFIIFRPIEKDSIHVDLVCFSWFFYCFCLFCLFVFFASFCVSFQTGTKIKFMFEKTEKKKI